MMTAPGRRNNHVATFRSAPEPCGPRKRHDEVSATTAVEWAAVDRAAWRVVPFACGAPQFTTIRCALLDNSNERQPACALADWRIGGGAPTSAVTGVPHASSRS